MTFGTETDRVVGGEVGVEATRNITVYGTAGKMQNIAPTSVKDLVDGSGLTVKQPAFFGIGGVKYRIPTNSSVRPYVLGGGGIGSSKLKVSAAGIGDITDVTIAAAGLPQSEVKSTNFLFEAGGGIEIPVGPLYVDTGYRFNKFVGRNDKSVGGDDANVSRAYVGVGYRFGGAIK
jgi:Outer membrane protein beta-barrel domain